MDAKQIIQLLEAPTDDRRPIFQKVKEGAPVAALIEALRLATTPLTRQLLADILGYREEKAAVPVLINALQDSSPEVRNSAADALSKIEDPRAGEALMTQYIQEDDDIRQTLAIALGAVGYRPAIPYLIQALSSPSQMLRICAAWGLRSLHATEAKDAIQSALAQETDAYSIDEMSKVLRSITSREQTTDNANQIIPRDSGPGNNQNIPRGFGRFHDQDITHDSGHGNDQNPPRGFGRFRD